MTRVETFPLISYPERTVAELLISQPDGTVLAQRKLRCRD